jgi:hypothetical protein
MQRDIGTFNDTDNDQRLAFAPLFYLFCSNGLALPCAVHSCLAVVA